MSSEVLYCIMYYEVRNLVLCLTRELLKFLDNKIILKLLCKNKFIDKNVMKIEELTWEYFIKMWLCIKFIAWVDIFFSIFFYFILKFKLM